MFDLALPILKGIVAALVYIGLGYAKGREDLEWRKMVVPLLLGAVGGALLGSKGMPVTPEALALETAPLLGWTAALEQGGKALYRWRLRKILTRALGRDPGEW